MNEDLSRQLVAPGVTHVRMPWDEYFMSIADQVAGRATCKRKYVGAVITKDKTILSTGYNGSVRGAPHCTEVGCMMEDGHCVRTAHAEANAIIQAAKNGTAIDGATIYTSASPCWSCFKLIANAGIKRIVFKELYRDERIYQFSTDSGIELLHLQDISDLRSGAPLVDRTTGRVVGVVLKGPGDQEKAVGDKG